MSHELWVQDAFYSAGGLDVLMGVARSSNVSTLGAALTATPCLVRGHAVLEAQFLTAGGVTMLCVPSIRTIPACHSTSHQPTRQLLTHGLLAPLVREDTMRRAGPRHQAKACFLLRALITSDHTTTSDHAHSTILTAYDQVKGALSSLDGV